MFDNLKLYIVVGIEYKNENYFLYVPHIQNISLYVCVVYKCVFVYVCVCVCLVLSMKVAIHVIYIEYVTLCI